MEGAAPTNRDRKAEVKRLFLIPLLCSVSFGFAADKKDIPEQQASARIEELKQKVARDSERDLCIDAAELVRELVEQFAGAGECPGQGGGEVFYPGSDQ